MKLLQRIFNRADYPIQAIIVCGKNKKLYDSLERLVQKSKNSIVCLRFVENIDEWMIAADVILTKAGGLTVSEALTKSLPMLIYKPIPGQEEGNALYIQKFGAGKIIDSEAELEKAIRELILFPEKIKRMQNSAQAIAPRHSADQAAKAILKLYYRSDPLNGGQEFHYDRQFYA